MRQDKKLSHHSGIDFSGHIPGEEMNFEFANEKVSERLDMKLIDLAFLYSFPLISRVVPGKGAIPVEDPPLSIDKEYRDIKEIAKRHGLEFFMSKEHATYKSLGETINNRARIIHMTCHGIYQEKD
jgi:hypothetical protein